MKIKAKLSIILPILMSVVTGIFSPVKTFAVANVDFQGVTRIRITREITNVSNPVTNTFGYTITPDANNPTGATNLPTSATIQFTPSTPSGLGGTVEDYGFIDFSGASFTKPGDYYFTVRETSSSDPTNYPVDPTVYTAVASVRFNNSMDTLLVTLVQKMVKDGTSNKVDAIWSSAAPRTYLEIAASTTGNVADLDLCFDYVVNIPTGNGIALGDNFTVSTESSCANNPAQISAGSDTTISLKNGDTIKVGLSGNTNQMPIGSGYSIKLSDAQGYTATFNGAEMQANVAQTVSGLVAVNDSNFNSKNKAAIVLRKDADVYTGIVNNVWTYVVILAIGATGTIIAVNQARRRKQ